MSATRRKQQIVKTALELVAEHGADAVSTQLIADKIGLTQGGVFRHFPTKEALWMEIIVWVQEQLGNVWSQARNDRQHPPPIWVLRRMFLGHVGLIIRYPGLAKVVFSDHIRHQYPSLHEQFYALHRQYEGEVTTLLEDAVRTSHLPSTTDLPAAATLFFCAIQGLEFQFAIARVRRSRVSDCAARIFALYMRAIGAHEAALQGPTDVKPPSEGRPRPRNVRSIPARTTDGTKRRRHI
jgi:AcrR family transcriptional regulator